MENKWLERVIAAAAGIIVGSVSMMQLHGTRLDRLESHVIQTEKALERLERAVDRIEKKP